MRVCYVFVCVIHVVGYMSWDTCPADGGNSSGSGGGGGGALVMTFVAQSRLYNPTTPPTTKAATVAPLGEGCTRGYMPFRSRGCEGTPNGSRENIKDMW